MADWRQIQARIRKAKNSPDAQAKLSELYQRTRDAMVAWELGAIEEKAQHMDEAGSWYTIAAQRFRRADWKKKAEEALTRLGIPLPLPGAPPAEPPAAIAESPAASAPEPFESQPPLALGEIPTMPEESAPVESSLQAPGTAGNGEGGRRKRRRGRRGGRGRRRKGGPAQPGLPAQAFAERPATQPSGMETAPGLAVERRASDRVETEPPAPQELRAARVELPPPQLPSERAAHGRGDPALASRMAHLESLLRRLLGSPLHRLDEAEDAPAGPGVFLLSESDQTASYYIEACQTLRIGVGNLARGGRGGRSARGARGPSEEGLKARLAEHLGINEAKVSQYMKDHCAVRWIQLDDEAPVLAHFAIGVLRTPLNLD
jgi:hypothetical protein